jgi:spore coat protein U-like protein
MTSLKRRFDIGPGKVWRSVMRAMRLTLLGASVAGSALMSQVALADPSCRFNTVTAVSFGPYDVFATVPNNNGVGSLAIRCTEGGGPSFTVTLSAGQSNSYAARVMKSGANLLNYNLYTSPARTTVWGDGTGGSSILAATANSTTTLSVFGQIPARQDATVGTYADSITATVTF